MLEAVIIYEPDSNHVYQARALQQYPIEELAALRGAAVYDASGLALKVGMDCAYARSLHAAYTQPTRSLHAVGGRGDTARPRRRRRAHERSGGYLRAAQRRRHLWPAHRRPPLHCGVHATS